VDALDGAEAKRLLATLIDARPELVAEVTDLADAQLGAVTAEELRTHRRSEIEPSAFLSSSWKA
jgi:hypothetical protein